MRKDPLYPNTVIILNEFELLQTFDKIMPHIWFIFQNLLTLFDKHLTLIHQIYLNIKKSTVLKVWHKSSFEILPIPAPQSKTDYLLKSGLILTKDKINANEKRISIVLRFPYPPRTPLYVGYVFYIFSSIQTSTS